LIVPTPHVELDTPSIAHAPLTAIFGEDNVVLVPVETTATERPPSRNYPWAALMARVFQIDVLKCEQCGGRLRIVAAIHPPETTQKILNCLGLPSRAPPLKPAAPDASLNYF